MYIKYNDTKYPCKSLMRSKGTVAYSGLPEDFPAPVSGDITLCADDGFEMRKDTAEDYLRQTFSGGVLTLTNTPEPEPMPDEPDTPDDEPTTDWDEIAAAVDAMLGESEV